MRRLLVPLGFAGTVLLAACADEERSVFDPAADLTAPKLTAFEIVQENQRVYALWSADEPVRAVVEYRPVGGEGLRHAYSGSKDWAEAGIVPIITVDSGSQYEIVGVRLTDRAGNSSSPPPPDDFSTLTTGEIARDDVFVFVMIDVGWGDALFMRAPDGTTALVDAGHPVDGLRVRRFLETYHSDLGNHLDFASMTHVHEDHIGGFYGDGFENIDGLLQSNGGGLTPWSVGTFLEIAEKTPNSINGPYRDLESLLENPGSTVQQRAPLAPGASSATHAVLRWGTDVRVDLLASGRKDFLLPEYILQAETGSVQNNDSMVYRVQYGDIVFLLMGDGEFATEQYLQDRWPREFLEATILKLGHHGSNDSNSERFIDVVDPIVGLITNAVSENPGVEHPYVLNRLRERGIDYFASDRAIPNRPRRESGIRGDIIIETNGRDFNVTAINLVYE